MTHPYRLLAAAVVSKLTDNSIVSARGRLQRLSLEDYTAAFGNGPAVLVSKGGVNSDPAGGGRGCRGSKANLCILRIEIRSTDIGENDLTDPTKLDAFDDFVYSVRTLLEGPLPIAGGVAQWVTSEEGDVEDVTRGTGDYETVLEISYSV